MSEEPENTPAASAEAAPGKGPETVPGVTPDTGPDTGPDTATGAGAITDTPPDRLAANPRSPFHDADLLERGIGIRFDGVERNNVDEYCVSEGWVKVAAGKSKDRYGNALTIKLKGVVEPYFRS